MEANTPFSYGSVLIVDDSEIDVLVNRRLMELTRFAGQVVITHDGAEALHYLTEECRTAADAPDWIFLDMHLPVMSGVEFIEAFKSLPAAIRTKSKIVILSVLQNPELLKEILQLEFVHGRLDKPLTQQALSDLAVAAGSTPVSF